MRLILEDLNLTAAEKLLCETALQTAGNIVSAAQLLGITRHALKRKIIKLHIEWPPSGGLGAVRRKDPWPPPPPPKEGQ